MQTVEELKQKFEKYRAVNKSPRSGCIETGKFSTWQCCEFHKEFAQEDEEMTAFAITLTQKRFPQSKQDADVPSMFWINNELMCVLSDRWWQLI